MTGRITGETAPLLSLIVPTEGRAKEIDALVTSIREAWQYHAQTAEEPCSPAQIVELLLVDSTEPALDQDRIAGWDSTWMSLRRGTRNVRQKRNQGAAEARGRWLAFVDSDCLVSPGYLSAALAGIERGEARAFAGRVEFRGDENAVWRVVAASRLISPETQSAGIGEVAWCATANMMIERCLFMRLGAFDESLPFRLGGDDVDLGLRLRHSGNALRVLPDAVVLHPKAPWSDLKGIISRVWRWGRIEYHLALRHPNKVTVTPPFVAGTALTMGITCIAGAVLTGRAVLLAMLPVWLVISGLLFAWFSAGRQANGFITLYFAGWLERIYHLASACEHLRAGSIRFVWGGLILEDHLEEIFPAEPLQNWSNLLAAAVIAIMGAVIVAG